MGVGRGHGKVMEFQEIAEVLEGHRRNLKQAIVILEDARVWTPNFISLHS